MCSSNTGITMLLEEQWIKFANIFSITLQIFYRQFAKMSCKCFGTQEKETGR
jgi:hypothetical protein